MLSRWLTCIAPAFLALVPATAQVQNDTSVLSFQVTSGGNDNYFIRDNVTSAQVLLTSANNTSSAPRRLVVALPAGNSGALTYFLPLNSSSDATALSVILVNGTLQTTTRDFNNTGIQADLAFNSNATLGVTIIGAVRAMRGTRTTFESANYLTHRCVDYVEGSGTMHDIFNYTLASFNSTFVRLHRQWINTTLGDAPGTFRGADLELSVPANSSAQFSVTPGNNGTWTPPTVDILVPQNASAGVVRVAVVTNETSLVGLNTQSLFLSNGTGGAEGLQTALQGLSSGENEVAKLVSFLTYANKFTAGGWRFLTVGALMPHYRALGSRVFLPSSTLAGTP